MFDIGFQELVLISVIALIVVGPERLPKMARTLGLWSGKIRYYVNQVKNDIDREVRAQELKELLDKPAAELKDLSSVAEETKGALDEAKAAIETIPTDVSTANEPAAGSIFPAGQPDPAQTETGAAQSGETPEPVRTETSAARSGETPEPPQTEMGAAQSGETPGPAQTEMGAAQSGETPGPAQTETGAAQSGETPEPARAETGTAQSGETSEPARAETGAAQSGETPEPVRAEASGT